MAPEPGCVGRVLLEGEAEEAEMGDAFVEVFALEVEVDVVRDRDFVGDIHRQRRFAVRTLEPSIPRQRIHDPNQPELLKKLHRLDSMLGKDRDLVEIHVFIN